MARRDDDDNEVGIGSEPDADDGIEDSTTDALTDAEAIAALERFVCENDDLLELEALIGRFNVFDALGVVWQEIRHSNFLAWLLNPAESHGQGQLFLRALLMDLLRETPHDKRPFSPVDLDGSELVGVEVRREWRSIDLLITASKPSLVVAIENKIRAGEHSNQLVRYREIVAQEYGDRRPMFVFLTPEGDEPSDEGWTPYTYRNVHDVLERSLRLNRDLVGDDVAAFLRHYLGVLRGRLMDDPKIDELCARIYSNHRVAIDLLRDRVSDPRVVIAREIRRRLEASPQEWFVEGSQAYKCRFIPRAWLDWLPPINKRPRQDPRSWIFAEMVVGLRASHLYLVAGPVTEPRVREALVEAVRLNGESSGFTMRRREATARWTRLYSQKRFVVWDEEEGPDEESVEGLWSGIMAFRERLPSLGEFLRRTIVSIDRR